MNAHKRLTSTPLGIAAFALSLFAVAAWAPVSAHADFEARLAEAIEELKGYEWGDDPEPVETIVETVRVEGQDPENHEALTEAFVELLEADEATYAAKDFVCKRLRLVGTAAAVPVLGHMLRDDETADIARYALEGIPADEADFTLAAELENASGKTRIGIIHSIGARGDSRAVQALSEHVDPDDPETTGAALGALGAIGGVEALEAIASAYLELDEPLQTVAAHAALRCADKLLEEEAFDEARMVYEELYDPECDSALSMGAFDGLVKLRQLSE